MRKLLILVACFGVAGCSKAPSGSQAGHSESVLADSAGAPGKPATEGSGAAPVKVSIPQIAYSFHYGFRLPSPAIGKALNAHIALCDRLGAARCQVVAVTNAGSDDSGANATLKLHVDSRIARHFGDQLGAAVTEAGGRTVNASMEGEDVSKDMSDTQARIAQRTLLVQRLTEILRTRQGGVKDLVETERSVAQAQEELDQAKGWLAELQGRVATSSFEIDYAPVAADTGVLPGQLGDTVKASASFFLYGLTALLALVIFLLPWAVIGGLIFLAIRAVRRGSARRATADQAPSSESDAAPQPPASSGGTSAP